MTTRIRRFTAGPLLAAYVNWLPGSQYSHLHWPVPLPCLYITSLMIEREQFTVGWVEQCQSCPVTPAAATARFLLWVVQLQFYKQNRHQLIRLPTLLPDCMLCRGYWLLISSWANSISALEVLHIMCYINLLSYLLTFIALALLSATSVIFNVQCCLLPAFHRGIEGRGGDVLPSPPLPTSSPTAG